MQNRTASRNQARLHSEDLLSKIVRLCTMLGSIVIVLSIFMVAMDILARTLFQAVIPGTVELVSNAVLLITLLFMPDAIVTGTIFRVELVYQRVNNSGKSKIDAISAALGFTIFSILCITSANSAFDAVINAEYEGSDFFRLPSWPVRSAAMLIWALCAYICAARLVKEIQIIFHPDSNEHGS